MCVCVGGGGIDVIGFLTKPCMCGVAARPVTEDVINADIVSGWDVHCVGGDERGQGVVLFTVSFNGFLH